MKRIILRITQALFVGMVALHCSWMAHADITTGLVLNYQFNEGSGTNITDSSGNTNHAYLYNQGYSGWATGPVGGAILLNTNPPGSNFDPDYVQTVAPVTLANQTNFTFALWAKALPYSPLANPRFFSPSGLSHWVLWHGTVGVGFWYYTPVTIVPSTDDWHHFAVTYDRPSGKYSIYVDGDFQATGPTVAGDAIRNAPGAVKWIFGHAETPSATYEGDQWKGFLSDLRMYNRILSASDIREIVALSSERLPIVINQQPAGPVTQYEGDPAINLQVTLSTGTLPVYQWWKDGAMVAGATNSTLTIGALSTNDSGSYTVVISNSVSVVTSSPPAVVTIVPVTDPLTTALVLNYKFNEQSGTTITDSSGNGNNATLYNEYASAWAPGRVNGAIVLNNGPAGSDCPSYFQTDSIVSLASQDNYTFAFWGKALPRNSLANPRIFTPGTHWLLWQGTKGVGFWSATPATVEPSTDFWHHFAVTYNRPAGTYTVYVDGVALANGSSSVRGAPGDVQWSFGHTEGLSSVGEEDTWKGYFSDMRMYSRALRPSDISAIVALAPTIPPTITREPQSTTAYATTSLILSVSVDGTQPISYQWYKNGSPVSGAISATYRVDSVTTNYAGSYTVTARNTAGSVTSAPPVSVSILTPPTTGYMAAILADAPEAYWRLDDTDATLRDTMGRHYGTYQGSVSQGTTPGALTGDPSPCVTFGGAANYATVPASTNFNGTYISGDFSMECWCSLPPGTKDLKAPYYTRGGGTDTGVGFFSFDTGCQVQYWRNPPSTWGAIYQANSLRDGNWHHLVATYNKAANTMKFYLDGFLVGADTAANFVLLTTPNIPITIGAFASYDWPGTVDEVAWYNQTLSSDRVVAHYNLGIYGNNVPLGITAQPQSQTVLVGSPVQFTVQASGLPPFLYQWKRNGVNIPSATNNTYSIPSAYFTDAATYSATVSHLASTTNSADAVLTVIPQPSYVQMTNGLVVHLAFDGDCNDSSGRGNSATAQGTPDYVPGIIGSQALHYWTDTGGGLFNYASLVDPNTMTSAWPDLAFGMGGWSASYWIKLTNYNRVPFLCSSVGGVRPTGDYYNGGGFATGCEYNSGLPGGGGTVELWVNGGFCWAVTNDFASDQWHHIVLTKAGADSNYRMKLYVDGVPNSESWGYGATTDSPNPWNIGQDGMGTLAQDGSGVMDDLGIWSRELTPLEVYSIREVGLNGKSLNQVAPVQLHLNQVGANLDLSWQAGTLLSSTNVRTGYTPVAGATAPFYRTTATGTATFFRVQQ
jgi:hypothetical protein